MANSAAGWARRGMARRGWANSMAMKPKYKGQTAFIVCTGPSLTPDVIDQINESRLPKFGVNTTYSVVNLDVFHACNEDFYDYYWSRGLEDHPAEKWTFLPHVAEKYGINYIEGRWCDGLSDDPSYICFHHGSGPQILNIAYNYGVSRMLLVGWDMRYKEKRHFFGEYPDKMRHFPRTGPQGELDGLIKEMETINPQRYGVEIINCTPDSAMKCFPFGDLADYL